MPKQVQKFAKYKINYPECCPILLKFCQIWSHCRFPTTSAEGIALNSRINILVKNASGIIQCRQAGAGTCRFEEGEQSDHVHEADGQVEADLLRVLPRALAQELLSRQPHFQIFAKKLQIYTKISLQRISTTPEVLVRSCKTIKQSIKHGQWLWLSWQSSHCRFQRSPIRIQSSAKNYIEHVLSTALKIRNKEKRPGMAHFKNQLINQSSNNNSMSLNELSVYANFLNNGWLVPPCFNKSNKS